MAPTGKSILILLDVGKTVCESGSTFESLRRAAFLFAQSMLLYHPATDRLGVFSIGSSRTKNDLRDDSEGSYEHIEELFPLTKTSFEAVSKLNDVQPGLRDSDYIDALYVAGDHIVTRTGKAQLEKHILLFTDAKAKGPNGFEGELHTIAKILRAEKTKLTVVVPGYTECHVGEGEFGTTEDRAEDENPKAEDDKEGESDVMLKAFEPESLKAEMKERKGRNIEFENGQKRKSSLQMRNETLLRRVALASDGCIYSFEEALANLLKPKPRSKKPVAKYAGTLQITPAVQIPVKVFSFAMKASAPSGKKLSWERTKMTAKMVNAISNTSHLVGKSTKALDEEDELMEEDLERGYAYGPQWVKVDEATKINMSIAYPKSLDVIGFVPEESIPFEHYMSPVDVVVGMSNVHEANCAIHALVTAMYSEQVGMVARYVPREAAKFVYLWPEVDDDGKFLYMTEIPTAEDIRSFPFAPLDVHLENVSEEANLAMEAFINARYLGPKRSQASTDISEADDEETSDDEESRLDPSTMCNPAIHMVNASMVRRALDGVDGTGLPPREAWIENMLEPLNFVEGPAIAEKTVANLKNHFHIQRVDASKRRKEETRSWVSAPTGDIDLSAFMPPTENSSLDLNQEKSDILIKEGKSEIPAKEEESDILIKEEETKVNSDAEETGVEIDATLGELKRRAMPVEDLVSEVSVVDIREESPVSDFKAMVGSGLVEAAMELMKTLMLRFIRRGDFSRAIECLVEVRIRCIKIRNGQSFNALLYDLFRRAAESQSDLVHISGFFCEIDAQGRRADTLKVITKDDDPVTCQRIGSKAVMDCAEKVENVLRTALQKAR